MLPQARGSKVEIYSKSRLLDSNYLKNQIFQIWSGGITSKSNKIGFFPPMISSALLQCFSLFYYFFSFQRFPTTCTGFFFGVLWCSTSEIHRDKLNLGCLRRKFCNIRSYTTAFSLASYFPSVWYLLGLGNSRNYII